jgi:NTP pyrophosphatase (non-canonical NTP hydrolase)
MHMDEYQSKAARTDQVAGQDERALLVPLLGLAGEVGSLLADYKKRLRDGKAHERFEEGIAEDLGDLLWYTANVATKLGLSLADIAEQNLHKVRDRWPDRSIVVAGSFEAALYDSDCPPNEQLPREFEATFAEKECDGVRRVEVTINGERVGEPLTDNWPDDDGYRFHDVFHFSFAALLGWSPMVRKLMGCKRKSDPWVDEIEDGARARIAEELVSHLVFAYAREHNFLEGVGSIDYHLLRTVKTVVQGWEVEARSLADWEDAILQGYNVWRRVRDSRGGVVRVSLVKRAIEFVATPTFTTNCEETLSRELRTFEWRRNL